MEIRPYQPLRKLRSFLSVVVVAASVALSCVPAGQQNKSSSTPESEVKIVGEARRADVPAVMVFLPQTKDTAKLWTGLHDELIDDFDVVPFLMKPETTAAEMSQALGSTKPSCVVLVNNPTVRLFAQVQAAAGGKTPPAVIVMTSYVQEVAAALKNVTGIAYEVPAVTSFVNVRNLVPAKVEKVGVLRRAAFAKYLGRQREIAAQEQR